MSTIYERKILNDPEVRLSFSDPLIPIVRPDEVTIELDNTDGGLDETDLRGTILQFHRFDELTQEQLREMTGMVVSQELKTDRVVLRCMSQDIAELQTILPRLTVTTATFPLADPQQGLGKLIPIVFGNAASANKASDAWEMPYVGEDIVNNRYDYLVGHGQFTNIAVYRNTYGDTLFLVPPAEYTVAANTYPGGYTTIRFALRQASFGGGMHRLFVAADCTSTTRNFVTAAKLLLNDPTFGLGLPVDSTVFAAEAGVMDALGSMYCDGVMNEPLPAIDYLSQLLIVYGITLSKNTSGEWTVAVDTPRTTIKARFGHGTEQQWGNVETFTSLKTTPVGEATKSLVLEYRRDRWQNRYLLATTPRHPLAFGKELRLQNEFIRSPTTADKVSCYIANRLTVEDASLPSFTAGQEARRLLPGDLIGYQSTRPAFNRWFRSVSINRRLTTTTIDAVGWSDAIYLYSPSVLSGEPGDTTRTDNTRTTPSAVINLSSVSSGVENDGQGGWAAYVVLQYTFTAAAASEQWAQTIVRKRRNGTTNWETVAIDQAGSGTVQTKITGLITGLIYDYRVSRANILNPALAANTDLMSQAAPKDTQAPAAPGTPVVIDQHLKSIDVAWTAPADTDIDDYAYDVRTGPNGAGSLMTSGRTNKLKASLTLDQVPYESTMYLRVQARDYSGNNGMWSGSVSFSFSRIVTEDVGYAAIKTANIGDLSVGTLQLSPTAVTTLKRQLANRQWAHGTTPSTTNPALPGWVKVDFNIGDSPVNMATASITGDSGPITGFWVLLLVNSTTQISTVCNNIGTMAIVGTLYVDYW